MAHDIFISHSSKDKPIADAICANLEAAGVRCWIAPRDIAPGDDWPAAISKAIALSRVMVLVFSSSSNSSEEVKRELYFAGMRQLEILCFKIDTELGFRGGCFPPRHQFEVANPPTQNQVQLLVDYAKTMIHQKEMGEAARRWLNEVDRLRCVRAWEALSMRQREVLQAYAEGLSRREVAQRLRVAVTTVDMHFNSILRQCRLVWETQTGEEFNTKILQQYFGLFLAGLRQL